MEHQANKEFFYEEWLLKPESLPGWEFVLNFAQTILENHHIVYAWIFEKHKKPNQYVRTKTFGHHEQVSFLKNLQACMTRDAICLIHTIHNEYVEQLLQQYVKVSEGMIHAHQQSAVFPSPIEIGEWFCIRNNDIGIVIHHDGERLCLLKKLNEGL
jgi:hypothetical protein